MIEDFMEKRNFAIAKLWTYYVITQNLEKKFGYCVTLARTMEHKMLIYSNQEFFLLLFSIKRQYYCRFLWYSVCRPSYGHNIWNLQDLD